MTALGIGALRERAVDKTHFTTAQAYIDFARTYVEFLETGLQATVVAQNNHSYQFFQYSASADFRITRAVNSDLFLRTNDFDAQAVIFREALELVSSGDPGDAAHRRALQVVLYTVQQSIGCALDGLPASMSNQARKVNGDLFERLMLLVLQETGFEATSGVTKVPLLDETSAVVNTMGFQNDFVLKFEGELKIVGSVKTTSKDRLAKVFIDKLLYNKLTSTDTPHVAIFLNDVQRRPGSGPGSYGINNTFLPGHFRGYTVSLNPLDGIYYIDKLASMYSDPFLDERIDTIDKFFFDDLRPLLARRGKPLSEVIIVPESV